ncbi:hypothetical protein ACFLW5_01565 [Chloroflexota bacterium]
MEPKYQVGHKVIIKQFKTKMPSARDSDIGQYSGQSGTVTNYYWITSVTGEVFYIYTVKIGDDQREIVFHEDEVKAARTAVR